MRLYTGGRGKREERVEGDQGRERGGRKDRKYAAFFLPRRKGHRKKVHSRLSGKR